MNLISKHGSIAAAIAATLLAWLQVSAVVSLADKPPIAMARAPVTTQVSPVAKVSDSVVPQRSQAQVVAGRKDDRG